MKQRLTAGLLAFFLGGIGVHKFYLGRGGQGLIYLLFCWTLIPGIIAFFEAIGFFIQSDDEFNKKYNEKSSVISSSSDVLGDIQKLADLYEKGHITKEEYEHKKKMLMQKIT